MSDPFFHLAYGEAYILWYGIFVCMYNASRSLPVFVTRVKDICGKLLIIIMNNFPNKGKLLFFNLMIDVGYIKKSLLR